MITETKKQIIIARAQAIRTSIIEMLVAAGSGHTAGPLGMADIFALLYTHTLRHDPKNPLWEARDRLVLSNGHICPVQYAAMAHAGYFPVEELKTLRKLHSRLQGHPHREYLPGIEVSSGPLGTGLSQAVGMAIAASTGITTSGQLNLSGTSANIALGSNYLSGDGGDEGVYVDASGNVGIGLTPTEKLHVAGNIRLQGGSRFLGSDGTTFTYDGDTIPHYGFTWYSDSEYPGGSTFGASGYGAIKLFSGGTPRVTVSTNGNVGIGTTTPGAKLAVSGGDIYIQESGVVGNGIDDYAKLVLHNDGTDASTTFTDSSFNGRTVTPSGNAQIDTAQSKFGGASALFDGSGDYLTIADSDDFEMGSGDFTIDFWFRPANTTAGIRTLVGKYDGSGYGPWLIYQDGTTVSLYSSSDNGGSGWDIGSARVLATGISANTWYHLAYVRNGNTYKTYLNGTQTDTFTNSSTYADGTQSVRIGGASGVYYFNGHIDEVRISKGIARWTADFTAPTVAYNAASFTDGGLGIGVVNPLYPIHHSSGAYLSAGGSWTNSSDRNLKENFTEVDPHKVLTSINKLDIQRWNYIKEEDSVHHIGPIAQDFFAQFGLGGSDTAISTIDSSGVALVGVQALDIKIESLTIASDGEDDERTFVERFFAKVTAWLADTANGIGAVFAQSFNASEQICIDGECLTANDVRSLKALAAIGATTVQQGGNGDSNTQATPTIAVLGNSSATIAINDTYSDLGAIAKNTAGTDISYTTKVDGVEVTAVSLDTAIDRTYTIVYFAEEGGVVVSAERTVVVGLGTHTNIDEITEDPLEDQNTDETTTGETE